MAMPDGMETHRRVDSVHGHLSTRLTSLPSLVSLVEHHSDSGQTLSSSTTTPIARQTCRRNAHGLPCVHDTHDLRIYCVTMSTNPPQLMHAHSHRDRRHRSAHAAYGAHGTRSIERGTEMDHDDMPSVQSHIHRSIISRR